MKNWNTILLELTNDAHEAGKDLYQFLVEQSPELVKEIIYWGIAENAVATFFNLCWILAVLICWYGMYRLFKKYKWLYWNVCMNEPASHIPIYLLLIIPCIILLAVNIKELPTNVKQTVKAYFAPRLYIIEYSSKLINN